MHKYIVAPDVVREITATEMTGATLGGDFSFDVGQNLPSFVVKPQRTRRTSKAFMLKVPQQIEDRRRYCVTPANAMHCLTDSNDFRVGTAAEGKLWFNHVSAYCANS
jgi:hypothetical protein